MRNKLQYLYKVPDQPSPQIGTLLDPKLKLRGDQMTKSGPVKP